MRGINKVILIGHLGDNPDYRESASGNSFMRFNMATSESYKNRNTGETETKTEWHRVVVFGKLAETVHSFLHKGSGVYVEGKLRTSKYQDKEGIEKYSTDVVIDFNGTLQILDRRDNNRSQESDYNNYANNDADYNSNSNNKSNQVANNTHNQVNDIKIDDDDDIPF